jgi:hypothetical protein
VTFPQIDRGYLGRILLLTLLAPDIVEASPIPDRPGDGGGMRAGDRDRVSWMESNRRDWGCRD